jgi:tRNA(fMet)-specific endonuclease VapC
MTRYLLDTNAVGDLMNKRRGVDRRATERRKAGHTLGTCDVVLSQLYFGVELSATRDDNMPLLDRTIDQLKIWPLSRAAARVFGRLAADLQRRGRHIGEADMLIASIVLSLKAVVLTRDTDFLAVPDLTVENWAAE